MKTHLFLIIVTVLVPGSLLFGQTYSDDLTGTSGTSFDGGPTAYASNPANAFDNAPATYWRRPASSFTEPIKPYIGWDFGSGNEKIIIQYTVQGNLITFRPTAWDFQGSNDGSSWTTIESQSGQYVVQKKTYNSFTNTVSYRYYRLNITAGTNANAVDVHEIEMMEAYVPVQLYSGGEGTTEDPYQISTEDDLNYLAATSADWYKVFIQTANITMSAKANHTPIGNSTTPFSGDYDGDGYTISGLTVSQSADYAGMFGYLNSAEIKDLTLTDVDISGEDYVGGLAGYAFYNSTITNVSVSGTVTASANYAGGLIGYADGSDVTGSSSSATTTGVDYIGGLIGNTTNSCAINNSHCTATTVSGNANIGGLIGRNTNCNVDNCYSSANVDGGSDHVGGFIGYNYESTLNACNITNSYCTASTVTGDGGNTGGFIGYNLSAQVSYCYTTAAVISTATGSGTFEPGDNTGGFIGYSNGSSNPVDVAYAEVTECYSTGDVSGVVVSASPYRDVGGFVGEAWGVVENCYSRGDVSTTGSGTPWVGAFIGNTGNQSKIRQCYTTGDYTTNVGDHAFIYFSRGTNSNNFYDDDLSSQTGVTGATGKTTAEMKTESTFTDASWDFLGETTNGTDDVWSIKSSYNDGYPNLDGESDLRWMGTTSTAWETGTNWNTGTVPGTSDFVTIPDVSGGSGNNPVIASGIGANTGNLTIDNGATLTINSGGSLITEGTIINNGTITMERQMTDSEWHLISIPTSGITANTFLGDYLQTWDETTHSWSEITDPETVLDIKIGYSLWGTPDKATYSFTGTPLNGNQNQAVTFTEYSSDPDANEGANLLGNPYPSSIDWSGLDGDDWGAVYFWDQTIDNGGGSFGNYATWNNGVGVNGGTQYIPPTQGFFIVVEAGDHGSNFSLSNTNRTHSGATGFYKSSDALSNGLKLNASYGELEDELAIVFNEDATQGYEKKYDAYKLFSGSEGISQLYTITEQKKLSIDVRPEAESLQLGFLNSEAGIYTIGIKEIADITEVYLEDTKTQKFHNLMVKDYEFTWNPDFDSETRFVLHFKAVGIEENTGTDDIPVYAANGILYVGGQADALTVTDIAGRVLIQQQLPANDRITIPVNLHTGLYMVTLRHEDKIQTKKVFIE